MYVLHLGRVVAEGGEGSVNPGLPFFGLDQNAPMELPSNLVVRHRSSDPQAGISWGPFPLRALTLNSRRITLGKSTQFFYAGRTRHAPPRTTSEGSEGWLPWVWRSHSLHVIHASSL